MDDPSLFSNVIEFKVIMYVIGILLVSECLIWFFTSRRTHNNPRKYSDSGTVWLIIIGWCCSLMAGAYFRDKNMPESIKKLLLPHFSYYIGIILILIGIAIRCMAVLTLKKSFTLSVQTTDNQHLIQTGLYSIVRNPAYTGSIISLLGVEFAYRHILGLIATIVICIICYGIRIKVEEKALKTQFKEEFENYCKNTKYRLMPGIY